MKSRTSAKVNANVHPVYVDVIQVEFSQNSDEPEMVRNWRDWSLKDIIKIFKDMVKPGKCYGTTAVEVGNIILCKLLKAAADPNVPFEAIEKTVYTALKTPAFLKEYSVLCGFKSFNKQAVCDFFKEFVKRGINDAHYYDLIYMMLTHRLNGGFPLGFEMGKKDEFNDKVLAKLPLEMQKQIKSYTFDEDDEDTDRRFCYCLITRESVAM